MRALFVLTLLGCASRAPSAAAGPTAQPVGGVVVGADPGPSSRATDPEGPWAALQARLGARHTTDLPDADELAGIPDVQDGLTWIVRHGRPDVIRARAAERLALVGASPETLVALVHDAGLPGLVRAGAVAGLAHLPALGPVESTARLQAVAEDPSLPDEVRQAAREHLAVP